MSSEAGRIHVAPDERVVALGEVEAVRDAASDPRRRDELDDLATAIESGTVDDGQAHRLERILDLGLHAGRIRALHGPGGEQAALRLYRRLPAGASAGASAREVTAALSALAGRTLDGVEIGVVGPGRYTLTLAAGGRTLSVRLDGSGARLASVEA